MTPLGSRVAWRFAGTGAAALVQFITYVLLARALGVNDYGVFASVFGVGVFAATLTGAGFTHRVLRLSAEGSDVAQKRSTMVIYRALWAALLASAAVALSLVTPLPWVSCVIAAVFIGVDAVTDICQAALAGAHRLARATVLLIAQRVVVLVAAAVLLFTGITAGLIVAAVLIVLGNLLMTLRARPQVRQIPALIRTSESYWRANLASSITQLEIPLIGVVGGGAMSGLYGAGSRAGGPVNLLAQALLHTATPAMSSAAAAQRLPMFLRVRRITWMIVAAAAVLAVPAGLVGVWILGPEFTEAWPIVAGFVVGGALMGVNQAHQAYLFAIGNAGPAGRAIAIGALTALGYVGIAAAWLPVWALALTPVIAQSAMQAGLGRAVRRATPEPH